MARDQTFHELLGLAAREIDRGCPTVFIHSGDRGPADMVLLSIDRYRELAAFWLVHNPDMPEHTHVEPDMLDDGDDFLEHQAERGEPPE